MNNKVTSLQSQGYLYIKYILEILSDGFSDRKCVGEEHPKVPDLDISEGLPVPLLRLVESVS